MLSDGVNPCGFLGFLLNSGAYQYLKLRKYPIYASDQAGCFQLSYLLVKVKKDASQKNIHMDRQDEQDKRHKTAKVQLFYPVYPVYPC